MAVSSRKDRRQLPASTIKPRPNSGVMAGEEGSTASKLTLVIDSPCIVIPTVPLEEFIKVRIFFLTVVGPTLGIGEVHPLALTDLGYLDGAGQQVEFDVPTPWTVGSWVGIAIPADWPYIRPSTGGVIAFDSLSLPAQWFNWLPLKSPLVAVAPAAAVDPTAAIEHSSTVTYLTWPEPIVFIGPDLPGWTVAGHPVTSVTQIDDTTLALATGFAQPNGEEVTYGPAYPFVQLVSGHTIAAGLIAIT